MKKLLLLLIIPILFSCSKDDDSPKKIDAPALPSQELYWGMSTDKLNVAMQKAGYTLLDKGIWYVHYYVHNSNNNVFWEAEALDGMTAMVYHYCGSDKEWARAYWSNIVGLGNKYESGSVSWAKVCEETIQTSNAEVVLDGAKYRTIKIGDVTYTSTVTAKYTKR